MPTALSRSILGALVVLAGCGGPGVAGTDGGGADPGGGDPGGADAAAAGGSDGGADAATGGGDAGSSDDGGIVVPLPSCMSGTPPAWRAGMSVGQWKQLASADIQAVTPTVQPGGGAYGRIEAWTGFGADTVHSVLYLGGVGGHRDYAGNEVYTLDLSQATPQWVIQMQPSPASAYVDDAAYYTDGRPSPAHTYWSLWFVEQRGKLFRYGGAATWGTGNGGSAAIDSWDPIAKAWDPKNTNPTYASGGAGYEAPAAKDFSTGDVYQYHGNNRVYRWNQATNTITDLGEAGAGGFDAAELYKSPSVVDPTTKRLYFLSDAANPGRFRVYDIGAGTWSTALVSGPAAAAVTQVQSQGMAYYDTCAMRVIYKSASGGAVYQVDLATMTASLLPTSGATLVNPVAGVHTLFQYVPKLGGYAYQPRHDAKLYFLATQ